MKSCVYTGLPFGRYPSRVGEIPDQYLLLGVDADHGVSDGLMAVGLLAVGAELSRHGPGAGSPGRRNVNRNEAPSRECYWVLVSFSWGG